MTIPAGNEAAKGPSYDVYRSSARCVIPSPKGSALDGGCSRLTRWEYDGQPICRQHLDMLTAGTLPGWPNPATDLPELLRRIDGLLAEWNTSGNPVLLSAAGQLSNAIGGVGRG